MDKSYVKAPVSGYLKTMEVNAGDIITVRDIIVWSTNQRIISLKFNKNDSLYSFKGIIKVLAKTMGGKSGW